MTVFTVITGGYDTLKDIRVRNDKCRYVCFTDDVSIDNKGWELIDIKELNPPPGLSGRLLQRWVKIIGGISYLKCDTVYLDGSHEIIDDVTELFEDVETDLCLKLHPVRKNYILEAEACVRLGKDDESKIDAQMMKYCSIGVPLDIGLYETGIIFRVYNENIRRIALHWLGEIEQYSIRDQISLPYALWMSGTHFSTFTQEQFLKYVKIHPHNG